MSHPLTDLLMDSLKSHWATVYNTKAADSVSWFQPNPEPSLALIRQVMPKPEAQACMIDIGAGDAYLVETLWQQGYHCLTALDISVEALARAQTRINETAARNIEWVVGNVLDFNPSRKFRLWHDRAALHFLTTPTDIARYVEIATHAIAPGGWLVLAPFAENGPEKCSGLPVQRYSMRQLEDTFAQGFTPVMHHPYAHITPGGNTQHFLYALLQRNA
ncbi:MAG: class I SAM-dependent methyltransferase [Bacteroidetes bacterium]|nr:class I SAM-dependent methyltransferase [Bacteroidota bacterium]